MSEVNNCTERILRDLSPSEGTPQLPGSFISERGMTFAGYHLLVDYWGAARLDDKSFIEESLRIAANVAGATLLKLHLHVFTPHGGLSGLALLAESHISIHTWPELSFAAIDVFMCGQANPRLAVTALTRRLKPAHVVIGEHKRGALP